MIVFKKSEFANCLEYCQEFVTHNKKRVAYANEKRNINVILNIH